MDATTPPPVIPMFAPIKRPATRPAMSRIRLFATLPILGAATLICILYLTLVALIVATDPYNVYSWGIRPKIDANDTPRDLAVKWVDVAIKDPTINTFLVGSSVTAMYTPQDIEAVLGPRANVYNLSYGGPRPRDRDIILDRLARNPHVRHIILTFDWMYIRGPKVTSKRFPAFLYDDDMGNDIRMVNLAAIDRTLDVLSGNRVYENPDDKNYARFIKRQYRHFQTSAQMANIATLVERYRRTITADSGRTCTSFRAINDQLLPNLRLFSARGVKVDILMPVTSYAVYYTRQADIGPTLLDDQLTSRRCLVEAVDPLPHVRVFALDDEPAVAGDLGNYRDPGHVYNPAILRRFLAGIATGRDQLTRANVQQYEESIRAAVKNYTVRNSYLVRLKPTSGSEECLVVTPAPCAAKQENCRYGGRTRPPCQSHRGDAGSIRRI